MKKFIMMLAFAFIGATAVNAQSGPTITFEEMSHDFGKLNEGPEYPYVFKFKNTGTAPLIINNVVTPCGCTSPSFTREPVAPGKTGEVTVKYNSSGRMGMFDKTLTVQTNMGNSKDLFINIKGEVVEAGMAPKEEAKKMEEPMAPAKMTTTTKAVKKTHRSKKTATMTK